MKKRLALLFAFFVLLLAHQAHAIEDDDAGQQEENSEPKSPLSDAAQATEDETSENSEAQSPLSDATQAIEDETSELKDEQDPEEADDSQPDEDAREDDQLEKANDDNDVETTTTADESDNKERKIVERGWRRRRRRRRFRIRIRRRRRRRRPRPRPPVIYRCGKTTYKPSTHSCCFNRYVRPRGKCPVYYCSRRRPRRVSVTYDPKFKQCCYGHLRSKALPCITYAPRCGKWRLNPRYGRCCGRGLKQRPYNVDTHQCCNGIIIPKCVKCRPWAYCGCKVYPIGYYQCCANQFIYIPLYKKCCNGRVVMDKNAICLPRRG